MKKLLTLFLFFFLVNVAHAFTEDDKKEIDAIINDYINYYHTSKVEARDKAKSYIREEYYLKYSKCHTNCMGISSKIRSKANSFNVLLNVDKINKEADEAFDTCMSECNQYKKSIQQGCDYINEVLKNMK